MSAEGMTAKAGSALTTWGPPVLMALLTIALFFMGYWLNGQAAAQTQFNDRLTRVEQAEANTESDVKSINSTIAYRSTARDSQFANVVAQATTLSARVDHLEDAFGTKLDKVVSDISSIKSDIAAIKAVAGAQSR